MNEKEWIEKIKKECILNVGNFDPKYAIQLIGRRDSNIGIVSLSRRFESVDIIDREKYEIFYDRFLSRNNKESKNQPYINYHVEHDISKNGFKILWDYYYKKIKK